MTFTEERVIELVREYIPADVTITFARHFDYIMQAMAHRDVQLQMHVGIYDFITIWRDFLGVARIHVEERELILDLELINNCVEGLPDELAEAFVRHVAAHEAHHIEDGSGANANPLMQLLKEHHCEEIVDTTYPELAALNKQAEELSPPHQRIRERVREMEARRGRS